MTNKFTLEITIRRDGGGLTIEAADGQDIHVMPEPFDLSPLSDHSRTLTTLVDWPAFIKKPRLIALGQALYKTLFTQNIESTFNQLKSRCTDSQDTICIRIQTDLPDIAELPWELMHDGSEFFAINPQFPIIRDIGKIETPSTYVRGRLKVLYACASNEKDPDWIHLHLEDSIEQLKNELEKSKRRIQLEVVDHTTPAILESKILEDYHVICFAGHATEKHIYLEDGHGGHVEYGAKTLAGKLKGRQTRLLFLAACNTSTYHGEADQRQPGFALTVAKQAAIPAVVGMQYAVEDKEATLLTVRYFEALAKRLPVDEALAEARKAVFNYENDWDTRRDVFSPVLYLQTKSSHLFRPDRNWLAMVLLVLLLALLPFIPWLYGSLQQESSRRELSEIGQAVAESTAEAEFATRQSAVATAQAESERRTQAEAESISLDLAKQSTAALERNDSRAALAAAIQAVEATYLTYGTYTGAAESALYRSLAHNDAPTYRISSRTGQYPFPIVEFSPDGRTFLASRGMEVNLWDMKGDLIATLDGVNGPDIRLADFTDDGATFITQHKFDVYIRVWNADGQLQNEFCTDIEADCETNTPGFWLDDSTISPDGNYIATVHNGRDINEIDNNVTRLWTSGGQFVRELRGHTDDIVTVQFSPDSAYILTSGRDGTARLWDLNGTQLQQFSHSAEGGYARTVAAAFAQNGALIVTLDSDNNAVTIWDINGNLYRQFTANGPISDITVNPDTDHIIVVTDGTLEETAEYTDNDNSNDIITVDEEGAVQFLASDNAPMMLLEGHSARVTDIIFSPLGNRFITVANPSANENDGALFYWDDNGDLLAVFEGPPSVAISAEFSADGTRILTTNGGKVRLWKEDGSPIATLGQVEARFINSSGALWATFSPTGEHILVHFITDMGPRMHLWDREGNYIVSFGEIINGVPYPAGSAGAFSPDGESVAISGCMEMEQNKCLLPVARLWDTQGSLLKVLQGHKNAIFDIIFSPEGSLILTRADEGETILWNRDGDLIANLQGHQRPIVTWEFSPTGRLFVTRDMDDNAFLWNAEGELVTRVLGNRFQFNSDGTRLIAVDNDNVYLYDQAGQFITQYSGLTGPKYALSPPANRVITVDGNSNDAQLWDTDGKLISVLGGHDSAVKFVAFSPDGSLLITGDTYTGRLWDVNGTLLTQLYSKVESVSFSRDSTRFLTTAEGDARLWSRTGELLSVFLPGDNQTVLAAQFSQDETRVLSPMDDGKVGVWAIKSPVATALESSPISPAQSNPQFTVLLSDINGNLLSTIATEQRIDEASVHPDGKSILTIHSGFADLWSLDGRHLSRFTDVGVADDLYGFVDAAFSPDGNLLISTNLDELYLWSVNGPKLTDLNHHTVSIHSSIITDDSQAVSSVTSVAFARGGQYILTGNQDWTAQVWDENGNEIHLLVGHRRPIHAIAISPDDSLLVTADQGGVAQLWNADGTPVAMLQGHTGSITKVEFNADGTRILTTSDDATARLWDSLGNPVALLDGYAKVGLSQMMGGFSADGRFVVTAGCETPNPAQHTACLTSTARIWDIDGQLIGIVPAHDEDASGGINPTDNRLRHLTFNPQRAEFATVVDGVLRVWNYAGEMVFSVEGNTPWSYITQFSSNGELLLTAGSYFNDGAEIGTVTIWNSNGEELARIDLTEDDTATSSAYFCPDSTCLISSHADGVSRLWRIDGTPIVSLEIERGEIIDTVPSVSGDRLVSLSMDGAVYLWGKKGNLLLALTGHDQPVSTAVFNSAESRLVTIDEGGNAMLWEIYLNMDIMLVEARRRLSSFIPDYSQCFTDNTRERIPECFQAEYDVCLEYLGEDGCGDLPEW